MISRVKLIDFITGKDIDRRYGQMLSLVDQIKEMDKTEYDCAVRLATALVEKHYPENTNWRPEPDLLGVLTQIDNITSGLVRESGARSVPAEVTGDK